MLVNTANADWGATAPEPSARPDITWLSHFSDEPDIVAEGSTNAAIKQCDRIVGRKRYCVVALGPLSSTAPFTINRSRTKVTAMPAAAPLTAVIGQATITINSNTEKVVVENLQLAGVKAGFEPVYGIEVSGHSINNIVLRNNRIYNYDSDSGVHGIVVLGAGASQNTSIHSISISDNHLHDMRTGSSETLAINGNVTNWVINNNTVERTNNIAIDAIGGEGIAPPITKEGHIFPNPLDAARNGWIENNTVISMSTLDNPAYGRARTWAGAIYVDGGHSISITGNSVRDAPWAYDIGAENCVITRNIILRNNSANGSHFGDLRLGGYAKTGFLANNNSVNCNPLTSKDVDEGHGYVRRVSVANNRFNSDDVAVQNILVEYRTTESVIADANLTPQPGRGDGSAIGDNNAYLTHEKK